MRHTILRRATRRLGAVIRHGPDALARVGVHDPTVVEGLVPLQLTHAVHLDVGGSSQLEAAPVRGVAFRLDADHSGPHERAVRRRDFVRRRDVSRTVDCQGELLVQPIVDVWTAAARPPSKAHNRAEIDSVLE